MRITHKGTEPGASFNTPDGDFTADAEGFFDVPDHIGAAQIQFPGWKKAGQDRFNGDPETTEAEAETSAVLGLLQSLTNRVDTLEATVKKLTSSRSSTK